MSFVSPRSTLTRFLPNPVHRCSASRESTSSPDGCPKSAETDDLSAGSALSSRRCTLWLELGTVLSELSVDAVEELEETAKLFMILRGAGYRTLMEKQIQNTAR